MERKQSEYLVLVSEHFSQITYHLFESFQSKLEELKAMVSCDVVYVENCDQYIDELLVRLKQSQKSYQGVVLVGAFIGSQEIALSAEILRACETITSKAAVKLLPSFVSALDEDAALDKVFGPEEMKGYETAAAFLNMCEI